jgi:hypothetical protein
MSIELEEVEELVKRVAQFHFSLKKTINMLEI